MAVGVLPPLGPNRALPPQTRRPAPSSRYMPRGGGGGGDPARDDDARPRPWGGKTEETTQNRSKRFVSVVGCFSARPHEVCRAGLFILDVPNLQEWALEAIRGPRAALGCASKEEILEEHLQKEG
jgi:hypothetical protein